ncbi:MAG: hypothetical protein U0175_31230 [Caldilineaceae bacterium]
MAEEKQDSNKADTTPKVELKDEIVETHHSITIGSTRINYKAIAGTLAIKDEAGKAKASIFFMAYFKQGVEDPSTRPLTISFNGGPGSSSVWLHLGVLGPRRVLSGDVGALAKPPYKLVDNDYSLLDVSDLVFIDPVSTGFSRPANGEEAKQFHGYDQDIESVGNFIRLFVTRYQRWSSPKFLIGESYGTTRAAGLSGYLQERHGMYLNGIMLISAVLDFQTGAFELGNDLVYALYLPSYAATAWYHGKLTEELQARPLVDYLNEVEHFATHEYLLALMEGDRLEGEALRQMAKRIANYTGLSVDYVLQTRLRMEHVRFAKQLLRSQERTVGRLDTRFTGYDKDAAGEFFEQDPSYSAIQGPYGGALNAYLRDELNFVSDLPYELLASLYEKWDYSKFANRYLHVADTLRKAMNQNPYLKVYVASGFYDLATPFFATDYTLNHLGVDPNLCKNVSVSYFQAGHMMYVHEPSLIQLKKDLAAFVMNSK